MKNKILECVLTGLVSAVVLNYLSKPTTAPAKPRLRVVPKPQPKAAVKG